MKREHFCQRKLASLKHLISLSGGRELFFIFNFFLSDVQKRVKSEIS